MSNLIDFQQLGGYRLEQPTFEKMQATYYLFLKAMIGHFQIPDSGSFIISGCTIDGADITPGIVYIDGILCEFAGSAGTLATKIKKQETVETLEFFNGTTPIVFRKYTAVVDAAGIALSEFVRVPSPFKLPEGTVIDSNYLAFTQEMLDKLNGIEAGAEVNVQADWNITNPLLDGFIKNKKNFIEALAQGAALIGDIVTNTSYQITFATPVSTSNYQAFVSFESISEDFNAIGETATLFYAIHDKTVNGFKIRLREEDNYAQNLRIQYLIIKL